MLEVLELNSTLSCELKVCGHATEFKNVRCADDSFGQQSENKLDNYCKRNGR